MVSFAEALAGGRPLFLDGATGTQITARGGEAGPIANLNCPDIVSAIHADYRDAGADILLTNTLTANRIYLEHAGLAVRFEEINRIGVELCKRAAAGRCYVCGDMTSTGKFLEPLGEYTEEQFYENAFEQAGLLARCGVDCIIIETMTDVRETCIDVRAAKDATGLPVIASMAFDPAGGDFRTMMGDTVEKAVSELAKAGADAIGVNCGTIDPFEAASVIRRMRALTNLPLAAQPNAGKPELSAGQVTFGLGPEEFAEGVVRCFEAGAILVGGCCGTTPRHIAALVARLRA